MDILVHELAEERTNLDRAKSIIEKYHEKIEVLSRERDEQKKKIEFLERLLV